MLSQAYDVVDKKHYAAIGVAMVPPVADYLYTQVTGAAGLANLWTEKISTGITDFVPEVQQALLDAGVMWNGTAATKSGSIVVGIILGTIVVFIIDKKFLNVAITGVVAALLSFFGMIHAAEIGINFTSIWGIGYVIMALVSVALYFMDKKGWINNTDELNVKKE